MASTCTFPSLVLFDGVCNLCNAAVVFVLERDPDECFKFASMQSDAGQAFLKEFQLPSDQFESFVLIERQSVYTKSTAALMVARRLKGLWPLTYALLLIPMSVRDYIYDFIARNRYRLFGKRNACMIPDADLSNRFLD